MTECHDLLEGWLRKKSNFLSHSPAALLVQATDRFSCAGISSFARPPHWTVEVAIFPL